MTDQIRHLAANNLDLAYACYGDASPTELVFLHGLGDSAIITFGRIAVHPDLAGIPALLLDLPGFGFSPAPENWESTTEQQAGIIISALDSLEMTGVTLMGHSMGGSIAILVAVQRPDLVARLIVAEPLLKPKESKLGKAVAKRTEAWFVEKGYDMLLLATRRQAARGDKAAQGFQNALCRADPAIMHRSAVSLLQPRSPSLLELLKGLAIPRTMLIGEFSEIDTREIEGSGITIVRIPGAGHSMMSENPEAFTHSIADVMST